ncbi:hypothetical protein CEXT_704051 [Caerostris extrusa]|uniref:Uncharacterized protein n=1 Tax=Caerostris extrusa TaxID=172846 RepID=A0AAV4TMH8_CAEEX|nr:hypothetical protein CEXT_704051 [Caerostris extrusa]
MYELRRLRDGAFPLTNLTVHRLLRISSSADDHLYIHPSLRPLCHGDEETVCVQFTTLITLHSHHRRVLFEGGRKKRNNLLKYRKESNEK